eukprot:20635-Heterococcus_DN1.PRE.8
MSVPDSQFVFIKAIAAIDATPAAVREVLAPGDIEVVRSYNPMIAEGRDLEYIGRDNKISYSSAHAVWPCRPRDFVTAITRLRLPGGTTALVQRATTHEEAPAHDADAAFVRAEILHGLFLVQPDAALQNKTHFTMVGHYNPGGGVPAWVMNQLAARNPASFIDALSRVAKQFDAVAAQHIGKKGNTLAACADRSFDSEPCPWLVNMDKTALHTGSSSGSGTFADVETAARGLCKETNNCSVLLGVLTALIAMCLAAAGTRRRRRKHSSTAAAAQHAQSNGSAHHASSNGHSTAMMNGSSTGDAASSGSSSSRNSSATSPSASQRRIVELYRSVSVTPPSPPVTAIAAAAAQDKVQSDATAAAVHNGSE